MVTEKAFRHAMSHWATGVTVITTLGPGEKVLGFTATSFSSLSLSPPLVLFCLANTSSVTEAFREAQGFVVNILGAEHQEWSKQFAGNQDDRFIGIAHRPGTLGMPVLTGALAHLECRTQAIHPGGDHLIFVGAVQAVSQREGEPLLYYSGSYRKIRPHS
ncbi:MAG: flavin reductase family protein [Deltaproteobacteria bacterium]|nr:flavin reductase family protein [Deltaproteobacteria bacterium]